MIKQNDLQIYLNELLEVEKIKDYCPNGIQVEGKKDIKTIITGVTACQDLLNSAVEKNADAVLVHHGYFWKDENPCITGMKKNRLQTLLQRDINLFAYHLPLDLHNEFGSNVQLAKILNISIDNRFMAGGYELGFIGKLPKTMTGESFAEHITRTLDREPFHIASNNKISTVAWCTGAAQDFLQEAFYQNVDAYLTGEVSERTVHQAREYNIHFYACGHHATERYGVQALGEHLASKFDLSHEFVDIDNPI